MAQKFTKAKVAVIIPDRRGVEVHDVMDAVVNAVEWAKIPGVVHAYWYVDEMDQDVGTEDLPVGLIVGKPGKSPAKKKGKRVGRLRGLRGLRR